MSGAIVWTPDLATGVQELDDDHKAIFRQLDLLVVAMAKRREAEEVEPMLDFLSCYARDHFAREESWMARTGYPELPAHCAEHVRLEEELARLRSAFEREGGSPRLALELRRNVTAWLGEHIGRADLALARFLGTHPEVRPPTPR
ncbi:MAG: bacteriohemerythrin [Myxococcota bacterium]